ncbi:THUMP domain-containing protein 3 [Podila epicladia]|nr:THUMP domain-containing protein 3 [Podila epicladia]KAG0095049.1 THUMP domain-containing protein 3 [Podila epicladia]
MALNSSLELTLAVPMGLEDIAVTLLPQGLVDAATEISYIMGTGYLTLAIPMDQPEIEATKVLSDLVQHPPLCVFSASITVGLINVPRSVFDAPKVLLAYLKNGFQDGGQENNSYSNDINWQKALSIVKTSATTLSTTSKASSQSTGQVAEPSTTFRASFDRGTIQHKGVRSQDVAAALGALTGKAFPGWKVNLTEYDVEVVGRWVQETRPVFFKGEGTSSASIKENRDIDKGEPGSVKRQKIEEQSKDNDMVIQVGVVLPLVLSSCPYRYRPVDGRTSLKIEIAYTLLAMAGPTTGDIVLDVCAGVGTIPIVGAIHFPGSFFAGSEIVPSNIDKAAENARGMKAKVEETKGGKPSHSQPSLFMGDAKAVCWRSGTVDLIVSDLPWGQRESSHVSNCKLYPKLVKQVIRLLRVGGRAVLVTGERKLLQRQLDSVFAKPFLQVVQKREITIGFSVMVFELRRI